jgi:hypothetical protein
MTRIVKPLAGEQTTYTTVANANTVIINYYYTGDQLYSGNNESITAPDGSIIGVQLPANVVIRVVNPGVANQVHLLFSSGVEYANLTVLNTEPTYIWKWNQTDQVWGNGMVFTPISFRD